MANQIRERLDERHIFIIQTMVYISSLLCILLVSDLYFGKQYIVLLKGAESYFNQKIFK